MHVLLKLNASYISLPVPEVSAVITEADHFERFNQVGTVSVVNLPPSGTDIYPPARVTDLLVIRFDHGERLIQVQFTVTGDDLLEGQG